MGKGKLQKFADMATYPHVFEHPYAGPEGVPFVMKGRWDTDFFRNSRPLTLELGCGRGEYTVGLAREMPERNFIGVDIKGARMWTGATDALREGLKNVAFLRTRIEAIDQCFAPGEVDRPADEEGYETSDVYLLPQPLPPLPARRGTHTCQDGQSFHVHLHPPDAGA